VVFGLLGMSSKTANRPSRMNIRMTDELPEFNERPFTCPLCGKETVVITPMDHIFATRVTCNECGKEFSIVNDKPKHLPQ